MYVPAIYVPPSVVYPAARISLRVYEHFPSACMSPPCVSFCVYVPSVNVLSISTFLFLVVLHLYIASMYISLRMYVLPSVCALRVYVAICFFV